MYFGKINHINVCSAVDFSVFMAIAFKYFGIKSILIPLSLDIIRSTRSRAINRKKTYNPSIEITTQLPITLISLL